MDFREFDPIRDSRFKPLVDNFIDRSIKKSKRYMTSGENNPQVPKSDGTGQADKIVHFINPTTTDTIIIIPPIKGNAKKFLMYMEYLSINNLIDTNEKIMPGKVVLFMAPFFSNVTALAAGSDPILDPSAAENNIKLLFSSLYFQEKNPESIHILQETELTDSLLIGKSFYTTVPTLKNDAKDYLLNYLNPSYVILPGQAGTYPGLIFSSHANLVKAKGANFKSVEDMIKGKKPGFSFNSNTGANESFKSYLTILSNGDKSKLPIHTSSDEKCNSLITLFYDHEIKANPLILPNTSDDKIIFLRFGNKKDPIICSNLNGEIHEARPDSDPFKGSKNLAPAEILSVEIEGIIREFRIPTYTIQYINDENDNPIIKRKFQNKVFEDWLAGIYSDKEAEFLNYLNLTPQILTDLVGPARMWKEDVAEFFFNLVTSKCFTDKDILTRAPCDGTREFLNKMHDYFYYHTMDRLEDKKQGFELRELHVPKSDIISWPSELWSDEDGKKRPAESGVLYDATDSTNYQNIFVIHRTSGDYKYMKLKINKSNAAIESCKQNIELLDKGLEALNPTQDDKKNRLHIAAIQRVVEYKAAIKALIDVLPAYFRATTATEAAMARAAKARATEAGVTAAEVTAAEEAVRAAEEAERAAKIAEIAPTAAKVTAEEAVTSTSRALANAIDLITNNHDISDRLKPRWLYIKNNIALYDTSNTRIIADRISEFKDVYHEFVFIPL